MTEVCVSECEPWLCYHDPSALPSTWDMQTVAEKTARDGGAVPCSQCFDDAGPIYSYDYMERDDIDE